MSSVFLLPNRRGQPSTDTGLASLWTALMKKFMAAGYERFQFRDLRAKSGTDHASGSHLGHTDPRTLERHYRRKPRAVTPLALK